MWKMIRKQQAIQAPQKAQRLPSQRARRRASRVPSAQSVLGMSEHRPAEAQAPRLVFPDDSDWPLGSGKHYKYRSRKGIADLKLTASDPIYWSSAEDGERNNRADVVHLTILVTNAQAGSQGVLTFQSSFDGVQYYDKGTSGTIPFFSGQLISLSPAPGDTLGNVLSRIGIQVTTGAATFRGWVTGRPRGRRHFGVVALDRIMEGTSDYYSMREFDDMFGAVDYLLFQVLAEPVGGSAVTLTLQIEESPDGVIWANKQATPEVNGVSIPVAGGIVGKDDGTVPRSKLTRFRLRLGGSSPVANVQLFVVGRGR